MSDALAAMFTGYDEAALHAVERRVRESVDPSDDLAPSDLIDPDASDGYFRALADRAFLVGFVQRVRGLLDGEGV